MKKNCCVVVGTWALLVLGVSMYSLVLCFDGGKFVVLCLKTAIGVGKQLLTLWLSWCFNSCAV